MEPLAPVWGLDFSQAWLEGQCRGSGCVPFGNQVVWEVSGFASSPQEMALVISKPNSQEVHSVYLARIVCWTGERLWPWPGYYVLKMWVPTQWGWPRWPGDTLPSYFSSHTINGVLFAVWLVPIVGALAVSDVPKQCWSAGRVPKHRKAGCLTEKMHVTAVFPR